MRAGRGLVRSAVASAVAALTACGTTATITRSDGVNVEGWIEGGSRDEIVLDTRLGQRHFIPRKDVAEIDHPGNVHVLIGGIVVAYGGIVIATSASDCKERGTCF